MKGHILVLFGFFRRLIIVNWPKISLESPNFKSILIAVLAFQFMGLMPLANEPTNQPTAIVFSGRTINSMTVSFTNASGGAGGYLLIYKIGSSPTNGAPFDGNSYNVGNSLGGGIVGARGSGPFTITGLTAGQSYFIDIYSYNGAGGNTNYLQSVAPLEGNAWSLEAAPTSQPTLLTFNTIGPTGFNGSFTAASPAPTGGYFGLRRAGAAVADIPIDGTVYSVGQTIGTSIVAFIGQSPSFSETTLASSTTYFYKVFSVGQIFDPSSANYYTSGTPLTNSVTTIASSATVQATNIAVSALTNTQLTLTWTNGDGARRIVLVHAGAPVNSNPINSISYTAIAAFGTGAQVGLGNYAVYDGVANAVTITGLTASTVYYFEVFEYNGTGLTANYLNTAAINNPTSQMTLAPPVVTQTANILFSSVSDTQMKLNWTNGTGARRVVLGHIGTAVNTNPANGTLYVANAVFASGDQIGTENFVVYDGVGNSVIVTGLLPSTVYDFQIFEYNGITNSANYLTLPALGNPIGESTLASPVTIQASNISFTSITNNSTKVGWTNGNGNRRVVLAHAGAAINSNPVATTIYSANPVFGLGTLIGNGNFVVYDGTDSSFVVTGLTGSTVYYFEVFEYNGTGFDNNFDIVVSTANPSKILTLTDAPIATGVLAIGSSSFIVSWNAIVGTTGYRVDISTDNFLSLLPQYNNLLVNVTSVFVTGLIHGTTYQVIVRSQNATGASANSNVVSILTQPQIPVTSPGTNVTSSSFIANWTVSTGATDYFVDVSTDINFVSFLPEYNNGHYLGTNLASITGLAAGTLYYYRVRAQNAGGTSGNSPTITQITVPAIPVAQNASNELTDNFIANWSPVQGVASFELDVTTSTSNYSTFVANYNALTIPDGTQTQEVVIGLAQSTVYKYRVRARNAGGVSGNSATKVALTLGGNVKPPTILVVASSNDDIRAQASDGFNPATNTITLFHRKITEVTFTAEADIIGSSADITVNPLWLDQIGMEYYLVVRDEAEKKDSTMSQYKYQSFSNVNISSQANFTGGGTAESYRIFSVPLTLSSTRIEDIFQPIEAQYGGIDKTKWRLVHYQGGQNIDYGAGLNNIEAGRSYWFNSMGEPQAINVSGSVTEANQSKGFILSLDSGFTQIGNPYPFNISWKDVLAQNSLVEGISGVGTLYTYDAPHSAFNKDSPILTAWGGGFVHSNVPIQITIPVNIKQARIVSSEGNEIKNQSIDQLQWFVPITINQGISYNNYSGPGMHPDAKTGYDRFDDFTVPRFVSYLEINSYHPDYHTSKFARDIVPTSTHFNWDFDVESNSEDRQATMTWDNKALGNNEAQLLLYDAKANMIIDMKQKDSYRFEPGDKRKFRIFFGIDEKSILPDVTGLGRAYPNPFIQSTSIPFITSADKPTVQIVLYDVMGRRVREMVNGRFEPGAHEGIWNGEDDQGSRVAEGIYIYRLTGTGVIPQIGRIALKQ